MCVYIPISCTYYAKIQQYASPAASVNVICAFGSLPAFCKLCVKM